MGAPQPGVTAAFVDKDQPLRSEPAGRGLPGRPGGANVRPVLLAGPQRFGLRPQPSRFSARQSAGKLRGGVPVRAASSAAYSAKLASRCSAAMAANPASWPPSGAGPPPIRRAAR